jgi:inositol phosphorylceramide mannosyltransferase catalytic subunit
MILVPKIFHQIWLGPAPMPAEFTRYAHTWQDHHPTWKMAMWRPGNLPTRYPELIAKCERPSNAANIYRYEILHAYGGVYIDTDFECRKSIEPLIDGEELFTAHQVDDPRNPSYLNNAFFGGVAGHAAFASLVDGVPAAFDASARLNCGPPYFTSVMRQFLPRIFPRRYFYPYAWDELERRNEPFPDAYAVHHWASKTQPFTGKRRITI